jgi:hypothetical protein
VTIPTSLPVKTTEPTEALQLVFTSELTLRVGVEFTFKVIEETAVEHVPIPVAVNVIVIAPIVVGVKVGFRAFGLLKVPPVLVHVNDE